jgi:hypothetical protein
MINYTASIARHTYVCVHKHFSCSSRAAVHVYLCDLCSSDRHSSQHHHHTHLHSIMRGTRWSGNREHTEQKNNKHGSAAVIYSVMGFVCVHLCACFAPPHTWCIEGSDVKWFSFHEVLSCNAATTIHERFCICPFA